MTEMHKLDARNATERSHREPYGEIAVRLEKREAERANEISAQKKRKRRTRRGEEAEANLFRAIATGNRPSVAASEHFGVRQIDDPYGGPRRVLAATLLRDDPLGRLHKRKQIDNAQMEAGRKWQEDWEETQTGAVRSLDPRREYVDGGRIPEPWNKRQMAGTARLSRCAKWLGLEGEALVRDVLGNRMSLAQCAAARGFNPQNQNDLKYFGRRLRECLETLAFRLGFATKAPPSIAPNDAAAVLGEVKSNPRLYDAVQRALTET
jgi:hypothetical protein